MITTDKKDFARAMIACFQNYRANIAPEMIDDWFKSKLFGFPFFTVEKAFSHYVDDYKNKFPPQRGQIIKIAYSLISGERVEESQKNGCVNLIVGFQCGEEIYVHGYCESCYEAKRPKTFVDLKMKKSLEELIEKAKADGCVTEKEIGDWSKKQLGLSEMGRVILSLTDENRRSMPDFN